MHNTISFLWDKSTKKKKRRSLRMCSDPVPVRDVTETCEYLHSRKVTKIDRLIYTLRNGGYGT